jgi:hypothetical protein
VLSIAVHLMLLALMIMPMKSKQIMGCLVIGAELSAGG